MAKRNRREYLQFLDAAKAAAETAIDSFNSVWHPYRNQTTLLLLTNAWELLGKAVLLQEKESIHKGQKQETISAEVVIYRLQNKKLLDQNQAATIQQIISLRHAACHHLLPDTPVEVMQHLLFYSAKFFRELIGKKFQTHLKTMNENYLSMSFSDLTTYADKVQRSVSRLKRSESDKKLIWLLERGIRFDGESYISETQFDAKYLNKKKVLSHLALNQFVKNGEMVRIVPVQAPHNYSADIILRRGSSKDASLPVLVKKTNLEEDYPYLTRELGAKLAKSQSWAAAAVSALNMKGVEKFHQAVRASKTSQVQRYSEAALQLLQDRLKSDPEFNPYKKS